MTKHILVGITGRARVGKDTAAGFLAENFGLVQYAMAGPIKDALAAMGFDRRVYDDPQIKEIVIDGLGVSYRKMAQTLGTEWGRSIHKDFWLILATRNFLMLDKKYLGMVVSDIRFENEAAWVREAGGLVIHIAGPQRSDFAIDGAGHASEAGVERVQGDVVVTNTGSPTFMYGQISALFHHTFGVELVRR